MKPKKKSKLQKKTEDPGSRYWRNKCDFAWRVLVAEDWGHICAICGSKEFLNAHHLVPRNMGSHRHIVKNGILLCSKHHRFSFELSAHKAPVAFFKWMVENKPDLWKWLLEQTPTRKNTVSFKETAIKLGELTNGLLRKSAVDSDQEGRKLP